MKAKVNLGLAQLSVPAKIEKARQIVIAITNNVAVFATPQPALTLISDAADALEVAYNNAKNGGKSATAIMRSKIPVLDDLLTKLGHYVEDHSSGNADVILLAGMNIRRPNTPVTELAMPINVEANANNASGEIVLRWKPVLNALTYLVEINDGINGVWTQVDVVSKAKYTVKNLIPGTRYHFRITAVGTPGKGPFSDSASAMSV